MAAFLASDAAASAAQIFAVRGNEGAFLMSQPRPIRGMHAPLKAGRPETIAERVLPAMKSPTSSRSRLRTSRDSRGTRSERPPPWRSTTTNSWHGLFEDVRHRYTQRDTMLYAGIGLGADPTSEAELRFVCRRRTSLRCQPCR